MYNHREIDSKWQKKWEEEKCFRALDPSETDKDPFYCLVEFPFPSGAGLHVGHPRSYTAIDVIARKKRAEGYNVLYPMGWDAFGLPTEQYAIKTGKPPAEVTRDNILSFKRQLKSLGLSFDWEREVNTTDPEYYKWTQWMFLEFYRAGLAYVDEREVWWCEELGTVLANEEVINGRSERGDFECVRRPMRQWMIRITDYADKLLDGLNEVDFLPQVEKQQRDWIGKSEGAEIEFDIKGISEKVTVFTTRPDTLFGVTYLVLAPEHDLVQSLVTSEYKDEVSRYMTEVMNKAEQDRLASDREKNGVFTGAYAVNPINGEEVPVWIGDYVLANAGTGAVMAVPAHDERDFEFAKKYDLPVKQVIAPYFILDGKCTPKEDVEDVNRGHCIDAIIENVQGDRFLLQIEGDQVHFPGGGVDEGESREEALRREIVEETGYINFEIKAMKEEFVKAYGFRIHKNINQITESTFFHVKLINEERVKSEIEDGKHEIEWESKDNIYNRINWLHHSFGWQQFLEKKAFVEDGILVNSGDFNDMSSEEAREAIVAKLKGMDKGRKKCTYRLRDWVFSRQRYWGEPFPMVWVKGLESFEVAKTGKLSSELPEEPVVYEKDGETWVALPVREADLPLKLPEVEDYAPAGDGKSALAKAENWVNIAYNLKTGEIAEFNEDLGEDWVEAIRETDTMPNWAGSSWYFLRYLDPDNNKVFADREKLDYWMPVNWYNGGMEHTTLHLLYSRFWNRFLYDRGWLSSAEPYARRTSHGMILAENGEKMSKSRGNVVNPDEIVAEFGADTLRVYELFIGPFSEAVPWSQNGVIGVKRFLDKVLKLNSFLQNEESEVVLRARHKMIKVVLESVDEMKFNVAVAEMMKFTNTVMTEKSVSRESLLDLAIVLDLFAPHVANELALSIGETSLLEGSSLPTYDEDLIKDNVLNIAVQVNGKLRGTIEVATDLSKEDIVKLAKEEDNVAKFLTGEIKREIYVPGKLVNFVV